MNKALMHCAHDIELQYFKGIPLPAAIRQMQYLINWREVKAAREELKARYNKTMKHRYIKGV